MNELVEEETPAPEEEKKKDGPKVPVGLSGQMAAQMIGGKAKKKFNAEQKKREEEDAALKERILKKKQELADEAKNKFK